MKKLALVLAMTGTAIVVGVTGGCGIFALRLVDGVITSQPADFAWGQRGLSWCAGRPALLVNLPHYLDDTTYLVVLQNNRELRPSGGFMGSYARLRFASGGLVELAIEDIYVPDGQIVGHVEPPDPIQQAFRLGEWRLRDANWDPDFPVAAEQVAWFFSQGKEPADGIMAVNLSLVQKWLGIVGPVRPADFPEMVTDKNFYQLAQRYSEEDFFPGSTQKRDFLGAVGRELFDKTIGAGWAARARLAGLVWEQLRDRQMLVWAADPGLQRELSSLGWDGGLGRAEGDYLYVVETNLGANKANCCIQRRVTYDIEPAQRTIELFWQNDHDFVHALPPALWGGQYVDYVRVIVPQALVVEKVSVGDRQLAPASPSGLPASLSQQLRTEEYFREDRGDLALIGFWAIVLAQEHLTAKLTLKSDSFPHQLLVKRQPGITELPFRLVVKGKLVGETQLDRDRVFAIK